MKNHIIAKNGDSYFGSIFFLIRPYVSPDDLAYNYRFLNAFIIPTVKRYSRSLTLVEAMQQVRKQAFQLYRTFNEPKFWRRLTEEQRVTLAWYTFIPMKQAVGRLQRNGCSSRVFYCDYSFIQSVSETQSLLHVWRDILQDTNSEIGELLYGQYLLGLSKALDNWNEMTNDEEWDDYE